MSAESPERLQLRKVLVALEAEISGLQAHKLNALQLKELKINIQRMSLDGTSDHNPSFFEPHARLPEPDDNRLNHIRSTLDDEDTCFTAPVDRARQVQNNWSSYTFQSKFVESENMPWSIRSVDDYTPYGKVFPHTKAAIYNNLEGDGRQILRGELLMILRLMLGQLRKRRFLQHMKAPVLLISFMGKCGRVIEAHFDGQYLHLGCTQLYNFRDDTSTALMDFAE